MVIESHYTSMEGGNNHIQAYLSFIQHYKTLKLYGAQRLLSKVDLTLELPLNTPKLVHSRSIEMDLQQTIKGEGSSFHLG